jgi:hypothetical protein
LTVLSKSVLTYALSLDTIWAMKRLFLLLPAAIIALTLSVIPVSLSLANGPKLSSNIAHAAVVQDVYCNDGLNGSTTDPAAFCAAHGGPADVSTGQIPYACADGTTQTSSKGAVDACKKSGSTPKPATNSPGCIEVSIPIFAGDKCVPNDQPGGAIVWYTKKLIQLASGAVGSIILLMLLVAGIQYITASGDPARVKAAKTRITNSIIALFLFLMAYAILSFLIPGGIFS